MRAVTIEHLGEEGLVREVPTPEPTANEVLVRITAIGVNPIDWKVRDGATRKMPFVLGQDFAGVVVGKGGDVTRYAIDQRVFGIARNHGSYAEFTVVPEDSTDEPLCHIPDDVGDAVAAALPTSGLTALAAIDAAGVREGTRLVIFGVTGGVGGYAAQIARDRGAFVIGVGHSRFEAQARTLGLDRFVAYDRSDAISAVGSEEPRGVDAILDLVNDETKVVRDAQLVKRGGTIISTIGAANAALFEHQGIDAINLKLNKTPQSSHEGLRTLVEMVRAGTLQVTISAEHGFTEAPRALDESKRGAIAGKIVLTVH